MLAAHGDPPQHLGLRAAAAAVRAAGRAPSWEYGLASAAATAGAGGDALAARWSAWLLVETLAADGRLAEAAQAARAAAQACAADLAYSWQTRFVAAELWCTALRGDGIDEVVRRAGDLTDRTLPALARAYAVAAASLAEADGGLLAPARARLAGLGASSSSAAAALDWVAREAAWLDGQPDLATAPATSAGAPPLVDGLRRITARWAAYDASDGQLPAAETALARPGTAWPAARRSAACSPTACWKATPSGRSRRCWRPNGSPRRPAWWCCWAGPAGHYAGTRCAGTSAASEPATTSATGNATCCAWSHMVNQPGASLASWASPGRPWRPTSAPACASWARVRVPRRLPWPWRSSGE